MIKKTIDVIVKNEAGEYLLVFPQYTWSCASRRWHDILVWGPGGYGGASPDYLRSLTQARGQIMDVGTAQAYMLQAEDAKRVDKYILHFVSRMTDRHRRERKANHEKERCGQVNS